MNSNLFSLDKVNAVSTATNSETLDCEVKNEIDEQDEVAGDGVIDSTASNFNSDSDEEFKVYIDETPLKKRKTNHIDKKGEKSQLQLMDIKDKIANGQYTTFNMTGKSKAWSVYAGIFDENGIEVENLVACKICKNIFKLNQKSTSNLLKHKCFIITMSKKQCEEAVEVSVQTKRKCVWTTASWALENCRYFKIIEDSGLKKFAEFLISVGAEYGKNVNLETFLPHPTTLSRNVNLLYEKYLNEIKLEVGEIINYGYGVTTDMWTDNYFKMSYLTVTIHYIMDGELKNRLLALRSVESGKSSGEHIRLTVSQILADFNCELNDKTIIVTDGDANMISAFKTCNHICCINRLLNTAVEKSIEETPEISELWQICSELVKYFKKTDINSKLQTSLNNFSPTRWNTVYYLLSSIGKNWFDITCILQERNEMHRIGNINLSFIDSVIKVLSSFEEASKILEGENNATLHWVYIYIHRLKKICGINQNDLDIVKALKQKLSFYLNEIVLKNISIYHKIALFLFPPTNKLKQFTENEKNIIKIECKKLMTSYVENVNEDNNIPSTSNISPFNSELLSDFVEESSSLNSDDKVEHEIRLYENTNVEFHDNFNVLQWWHLHKAEFPLLNKVSCKILSTPASSAASERTFSKAINLISEKRSHIGTNIAIVNQIMFLHFNANNSDIYSEVQNVCDM